MYTLGIDLGTTYSAAAVFEDGRPQVFDLGERSPQIPSVVAVKPDGEVLVGEAAERRSVTDPTRTAREFKRRLGDPTPLVLGGVPFGVEALEAQLVAAIVRRVRLQRGGDPDQIALTHPANYGPYKQDLLQEVLRLADVTNATLLTEPQAAAIHYATQAQVGDDEIVAVYDFGGGTFDATLLRRTGATFVLIGEPEGLERLGGIDFDHAVYAHVRASVGNAFDLLDLDDPSHQSAVARLRDECRSAKEALSSDTDVGIPVLLPTITTEVRLTRREFEDMIRPRVDETIACLGRVLRGSKVQAADVGRILLVGGTSRVPLVGEMVGQAFDRPLAMDAHPKFAVALGAARFAATEGTTEVSAPAPVVPGARPEPQPPLSSRPTPMPLSQGEPSPIEPPSPPPPPPSTPSDSRDITPVPPGSSSGRHSRSRALLAVAAGIVLIAGVVAFAATRGSSKSSGAVVASGGDRRATLPDSTIVFTSNRTGDIDLYTLDTHSQSAAPVDLNHDPGFDGVPAVSPDRTQIAFEHSDDPNNAAGHPRSLRLINADGSNEHVLDPDVAADARPSWSPDGKEIVYPDAAGNGADLVVLTLATGSTRPLVVDPEIESDASWSPDGAQISFTKNTVNGQQIFVVAADGSSPPRLLIDDNGAADAEWSHDGKLIVYDGQRAVRAQLTIVNADGSGRRVLLASNGKELDPAWSPDDDTVVFSSDQDGNSEIYLVGADGTNLRRLTNDPALDAQPTW